MRYFIWCFLLCMALTGCNKSDDGTANENAANDSQATMSESGSPDSSSIEPADTGSQEVTVAGGTLTTPKVRFTIPQEWEENKEHSPIVMAEFVLPRAEGDAEDGRLTVSTAGGSIDDNIARWRSQFGNSPEKELVDDVDVGEWTATVVDYSGEFDTARGPFAPGEKKAGYRMLGAIIPIDGELHFVKASGPAATMEAHYERFREFVQSAQPVRP